MCVCDRFEFPSIGVALDNSSCGRLERYVKIETGIVPSLPTGDNAKRVRNMIGFDRKHELYYSAIAGIRL